AFKLQMQGWSNGGFFDFNQSWPIQYPELHAASGQMRVAELFDVPGMDGVVTPYDYNLRGVNGLFFPEGITDSVILRNKLKLVEWDIRTYMDKRTNPKWSRQFGMMRDLEEFKAIMWRDLANAL